MCPGVSWGILGCPGVIRLTRMKAMIALPRQICQKKIGPFLYQNQTIGPSIYFLFKKGGLSYTWRRKLRILDRHAHPYFVIYMELPPSTHTHPPPRPREIYCVMGLAYFIFRILYLLIRRAEQRRLRCRKHKVWK